MYIYIYIYIHIYIYIYIYIYIWGFPHPWAPGRRGYGGTPLLSAVSGQRCSCFCVYSFLLCCFGPLALIELTTQKSRALNNERPVPVISSHDIGSGNKLRGSHTAAMADEFRYVLPTRLDAPRESLKLFLRPIHVVWIPGSRNSTALPHPGEFNIPQVRSCSVKPRNFQVVAW